MNFATLILCTSLSWTVAAQAEKTITEKVGDKMEATGDATKEAMDKAGKKTKELYGEAKVETKKAARATSRAAKKGVNRVEEAACMDGDMKCAAKKAGNRVEETKDATVDAVKDAADEMSK